jgi:hypothetical protein
MPSTYVPARSVAAPAAGADRPATKRRLRELTLLFALAAPAALAQQAQPVTYDATWSRVNGGGGASAANNFAVVGTLDITGGTKATGGAFTLSSGLMSPAQVGSGTPGDMIFLSSFD